MSNFFRLFFKNNFKNFLRQFENKFLSRFFSKIIFYFFAKFFLIYFFQKKNEPKIGPLFSIFLFFKIILHSHFVQNPRVSVRKFLFVDQLRAKLLNFPRGEFFQFSLFFASVRASKFCRAD